MWRDEPSEFTTLVGQCFILNGNCQTGEAAGDQKLRHDNKCAMCICHPVRTWGTSCRLCHGEVLYTDYLMAQLFWQSQKYIITPIKLITGTFLDLVMFSKPNNIFLLYKQICMYIMPLRTRPSKTSTGRSNEKLTSRIPNKLQYNILKT